MTLAISLDSAAKEKELVLLFVFNNLDFKVGLRGLSLVCPVLRCACFWRTHTTKTPDPNPKPIFDPQKCPYIESRFWCVASKFAVV